MVLSLINSCAVLYILDITTVQCSTTVDCAISDLGTMTPRDCCVGTQSSLAYTVPGSAECHPCVGRLCVKTSYILILFLKFCN